ncbi:MAG: methyltransferase domain-containing protein [Anaerolineae bacterium]|nr:methyltransferase domain-containing protein [Anaerolineae bacterium]
MRRGVNYDLAAGVYAAHRQVHRGVFEQLAGACHARPGGGVLEVGCGTGNYIQALAAGEECTAWGLDPSTGMLRQASASRAPVTWLAGRAEALPCAARSFDLIFSVDVIHHVADRARYFHEVARILHPGRSVCTVTDSAEIIRQREVLSGYFPDTVEVELARYPRLAEIEAWMAVAGLRNLRTEVVEEPYLVTDAGPYRDRAYSSLHLIPDEAWRAGVSRLERDLAHGPVSAVSRYACVWGNI